MSLQTQVEVMTMLQELMCDLAKVDRNHHIPGTDRPENDVEHSYSVAILAWYLFDRINPELDFGKVMKYALVHDWVEIYAGDVNTFAPAKQRQQKKKDEEAAYQKLESKLSGCDDLMIAVQKYKSREDEESLFVWTIDKIQAIILADIDDWKPYRRYGVTLDMYTKRYNDLTQDSSKYARQIFEEVVEYCKVKYYDQDSIKEEA